MVLSVYGLTGSCALRASCGFCVRSAVRCQGVRRIPWLLICGSLAAVDRGQGVCLSWCRSGSQRPLWCVCPCAECRRLMEWVRSSVGSCAVSALTVGKVSGSKSADHLGGASSLHGFSVLSSICIHRGFYPLFYRSYVHTHIGIIYIIYTILCIMIFVVIQGMMIYSNSMNTQ